MNQQRLMDKTLKDFTVKDGIKLYFLMQGILYVKRNLIGGVSDGVKHIKYVRADVNDKGDKIEYFPIPNPTKGES